MTISKEDITAILAQQWEHVTFKYGVLRCHNCGETSNSAKKAQSLANHLHTVVGFVHIHLNCKPPSQ